MSRSLPLWGVRALDEAKAMEEAEALVASPDPGTWIGSRDRAPLLVAVQKWLAQ